MYKKIIIARNKCGIKAIEGITTDVKGVNLMTDVKAVKPLSFWANLAKEIALLLDYVLVNYGKSGKVKWNFLSVGKHIKLGYYVYQMVGRIIEH